MKRMERLNEILETNNSRVNDMVDLGEIAPQSADHIKLLLRYVMVQTLDAASTEANGWTGRCDDAKRIPDVLREMAGQIDTPTHKQ